MTHRFGYTLIELLVTLSIMALLAAAVAPGISQARRGLEIDQSAQIIKEKLIETQGLALSPPSDNAGAIQYGLQLTGVNPVQYRIIRQFPNGTITDFSTGGQIPNVKLDSPAIGPEATIWFVIGNRPTIISSQSGSNAIIKLSSQNGSGQRTITTNKITGAIDVTNP
jgi:prepilin-type N-terminal cleavage/methylation domain-containing protein